MPDYGIYKPEELSWRIPVGFVHGREIDAHTRESAPTRTFTLTSAAFIQSIANLVQIPLETVHRCAMVYS